MVYLGAYAINGAPPVICPSLRSHPRRTFIWQSRRRRKSRSLPIRLRARESQPPKKSSLSPAVLLVVIGAVVLVVAGIIVLATRANSTPLTTTSRVGEGAVWGPANAPVKVVIYSDFGCSHCKDWGESQEKQLRADYEASGNVRYEYKSQNIGGTATRDAADAAECAADQGRFWDYHDALFARQGTTSNPFAKALLKRYAAELGLDSTKFDQLRR